jgi:flagellar hook protein FlgE
VNITQNSLQGVQRAEENFNTAAAKASKSLGGNPAVGNDTVDISSAAVSVLSAQNDYSVNLAFLKDADKMEKQAINLIG